MYKNISNNKWTISLLQNADGARMCIHTIEDNDRCSFIAQIACTFELSIIPRFLQLKSHMYVHTFSKDVALRAISRISKNFIDVCSHVIVSRHAIPLTKSFPDYQFHILLVFTSRHNSQLRF